VATSFVTVEGIFPEFPNQWLPQPTAKRSGKNQAQTVAARQEKLQLQRLSQLGAWIHLVRAGFTISRGGGLARKKVRWWSMKPPVEAIPDLAPGAALKVAHLRIKFWSRRCRLGWQRGRPSLIWPIRTRRAHHHRRNRGSAHETAAATSLGWVYNSSIRLLIHIRAALCVVVAGD